MTDSSCNTDRTPVSRTSIDWAVGALMALRGYTPEKAFEELAAHSHDFDVSLLQSARSLVAAARDLAVDSPAAARTQEEWGGLLADHRPARIDSVA